MANKISKIKLYNSNNDTINAINKGMIQMGVSAKDMTLAIKQLQKAIADIDFSQGLINHLQNEIDQLTCTITSQEAQLNSRAAAHENSRYELRPDLDAKTEIPNQKSDLEIFNRIVPSEEFLKLEGNMFLD